MVSHYSCLYYFRFCNGLLQTSAQLIPSCCSACVGKSPLENPTKHRERLVTHVGANKKLRHSCKVLNLLINKNEIRDSVLSA